jgi:tetratricopeptide (TPR) repeat protein
MRPAAALVLIGVFTLLGASRLDDAIAMQRAGKLNNADETFRIAITELRASRDQSNLARALSAESWISVALGKYRDAIQQSTEAMELRRNLHDQKGLGDDLNTLALANQNLGDYRAAIDYFGQALTADRAARDTEGEITLLNNIANVFYFQGRYFDALRSYEQAKTRVDATSGEPWNPRRRQMTLANLATLYQRLGQEQAALELYRELAAAPEVENVNLPDGTVLTVSVTHAGAATTVGTITLNAATSEDELELDSQHGDTVPSIVSGDMITVSNGAAVILAGVF